MSDETKDKLALTGVWLMAVMGCLIVWVAVMLSDVPLSAFGGGLALNGAYLLGRFRQASKVYDED